MATKQDSGSSVGSLTGFIALLVIVVVVAMGAAVCATGAAAYYYRMATETSQRELASRAHSMAVEQNLDTVMFFSAYYKHIVGAQILSDAELNIVRSGIAGDTEMATVLENFEADMASINEVLGPNRQAANYHEAVVACRELFDEDAD